MKLNHYLCSGFDSLDWVYTPSHLLFVFRIVPINDCKGTHFTSNHQTFPQKSCGYMWHFNLSLQ